MAICFVLAHLLLGFLLLMINALHGINDQDVSFAIAMLFHYANYPTVWMLRLFGVNPSIGATLVAGIVQWGVIGGVAGRARGRAMLMKYGLTLLAALMFPLWALQAADAVTERNDAAWLREKGELIFHDAFDREEDGNLAKAIGNGWNSATANRVPNIKMADLDQGILKIASASKEAGHSAHIHHEAGFTNGGVIVRFKFPGISKGESLQLGFVDRETQGVHAGHLCYGILSPSAITLSDHKTGVMNLEIRKKREECLSRKEKLPADLDALLKTKQRSVPWKADTEWHELVLVTEGDQMRLSIDGKLLVSHNSEGFAHPMKRWFSFLVPNTVWIDDVKIWKTK